MLLLNQNQKRSLSLARSLSKAFQVRVEIRLFGKLVFKYVWPPEEVVQMELEEQEGVQS